MLNIDDYMDVAKKRQGFTSNRQLSATLGLNPNSASHFVTRRAWPSDEVMVKLAELAGLDPLQALIDLNLWRQQSPQVRNIYASLSKIVSEARKGTAAIIIAGSLTLISPSETKAAQIDSVFPETINYANQRYVAPKLKCHP